MPCVITWLAAYYYPADIMCIHCTVVALHVRPAQVYIIYTLEILKTLKTRFQDLTVYPKALPSGQLFDWGLRLKYGGRCSLQVSQEN